MTDKVSPINNQEGSSANCVRFHREGDTCHCSLHGSWSLDSGEVRIARSEWKRFLSSNPTVSSFRFSAVELGEWDSALIVFLNQCRIDLAERKKEFDATDLPQGIARLLSLCIGKKTGKRKSEFNLNRSINYLESEINRFRKRTNGVAAFIGEWVSDCVLAVGGKSNLRMRDLLSVCRSCGASALPIVTLISFLTGLTLAFVGSVQLEKFNAKIYVADLVCLAMVREMGALMVAIIMAGRTGAAFAAELGSMKLNEEIDSLRTFGISPMQFLVLPRTIGLLLMIPLLTLYAGRWDFGWIDRGNAAWISPCCIILSRLKPLWGECGRFIQDSSRAWFLVWLSDWSAVTRGWQAATTPLAWPIRDLGRRHEHHPYRGCGCSL